MIKKLTMSRPTRTASLIASQRISNILRPKNSSRVNSVMGDSVCEVIEEEEWTHCDKFSPFLPSSTYPNNPSNSPRVPFITIPSPKESNPLTFAPRSDPFVPITDLHTNDRFTEYMGTKHYIRMMLERSQSSFNPEDHTAISIHIFEHLVAHPTILIYEPRFRETIVSKMKEFENSIYTQTHSKEIKELEETFWNLKSKAYSVIQHSQLRNKINSHMTDLIQMYQEYLCYLNRSELVRIIATLKQILIDIKKHPKYVA